MAGKGGWARRMAARATCSVAAPNLAPHGRRAAPNLARRAAWRPAPNLAPRRTSRRAEPRARATCSVAAGGLGVLAVILDHFFSQMGRNIVIVIEGGAEGTAAPGDRA